jgi:hypothetical protein
MPNAESTSETAATSQPVRTPKRRSITRCTIITEP